MYIDYTEGLTYNEYISQIIKERGQWNIPDGDYWEGHHIIPKCMGGTGSTKNKDDNIIRLYAREHFIAHRLLAIENPTNYMLLNAYVMMAFPSSPTQGGNRYELTPEEYEEARIKWSKYVSEHNFGLDENGHSWSYGKTKETDKRILKIALKLSESKKGIKLGPFTEEHKNNISKGKKKFYAENPDKKVGYNKGKVSIVSIDNTTSKYIDKDVPLPEGFEYGSIKGRHYNMDWYYSNPDEIKKRKERASGENNPMYGKGYLISGGKNGKATKYYVYDDIRFECRKDLVKYLNSNGYDISVAAIRNIENNTYSIRTINKYGEIIDKLKWGLKDENKVN